MTLEKAHRRIEDARKTGATELDLSWCEQVIDLSLLKDLSALLSLNLTRCEHVSDLSPLEDLSALQSLNLDGCGQVRDLSPLKDLSALQSLNLTWCAQVSDFSPLKNLSALQSLNLDGCGQVRDLSPLKNLFALRSLFLFGCVQVSDLSPLKDLSALQSLGLSGCRQVSDLSPLKDLSALQSLDLFGCGRSTLPSWIVSHPALTKLFANRFTDVPAEVLSTKEGDDCLPRLRAWWQDQQGEAVAEPEVKVFLLGNGKSGKTQLCRFLQELPFQDEWNSTHGVQLVHLPRDQPPVRAEAHLNVWDFGGQDIYHGTHALFLKSQAVFLILWTPDLEAAALAWEPAAGRDTALDYEDRPRPLAYWLDYVRELAGAESPALLIQSKCEDRIQVRRPDAALVGMLPVLPPLSFSARTRYGGETLLGALRDAVAELHRQHPSHTYGRGWVTVRDRCHALRAAGTRTLTLAKFRAICKKAGGVSDSSVLLEVLHRAGVIFHRGDLFGGKIIVDQGWALEAIYTVFDRHRCVPHLRGDGTVTRRELDRLAWGEVRRLRGEKPFTEAEQELFLSMMVSCGICFAWRKNAQGEQVYLAPELLPPRAAVREHLAGRLQASALPRQEVIFRYRFLHEGVVRELLSTVGRHAQDAAVYWRNGLWLYEGRTEAYAVIEASETPAVGAGAGEIVVAVYGDRSDALAALLREVIEGLSHRPSEVIAQFPKALPLPSAAPQSGPLAAATFPLPVPTPRGNKPTIFLSHAWGDDTESGRRRAAVAERCRARLDRAGFDVVMDRTEMEPGESISAFIDRFAFAEHVVAIVSEKYLRSPYCMREAHSVWQTCAGRAELFRRRYHALILEDGRIGSPDECAEWVRWWKQEHDRLEGLVVELKGAFGSANFRRLEYVGDFHRHVANMLGAMNDVLMPRRFEDDADFDGLIELLRRG